MSTFSNSPPESLLTCRLDNSIHVTIDDLHKYLRRFKLKQEEYYETYFPRKDLGTGEVIKYKSFDSYFNQDFLNKNSLKRYLKVNPVEGKTWSINWLKKRKEDKELIYAPCQTELRSLVCPTVTYFNSIGGYCPIARSIGYSDRFNDEKLIFKPLATDCEIVCDTREQKAIKLAIKTNIATIKEGDYALDTKYDQGIYIERKSIADFVGTLGKDFNRFDRELARAQKKGSYIVLMVESDLTDALSFDYLPQLRWSKAKPSHIFHNLRELLIKYPLNFQPIFVDGRIEMAQKMIKIFELGSQVKSVDLQYRYEQGEI